MSKEILNKKLMWYKSKMQAFPGTMIITEDRLTFLKPPKWTMMFGAIGALIGAGAKGKPMIDEELKNLKIKKGRDLRKNYMLNVTTPDGKEYDFLFDDKLKEQIAPVISLD